MNCDKKNKCTCNSRLIPQTFDRQRFFRAFNFSFLIVLWLDVLDEAGWHSVFEHTQISHNASYGITKQQDNAAKYHWFNYCAAGMTAIGFCCKPCSITKRPKQKKKETMKCRLCSRHPLHSGLVQSLGTFYDIRTGNGAGLFSKEKITEGGISKDKVKKKRTSGEAYDVNKQTIYIAPKIPEIKNRIKGRIMPRSPHMDRAK